MTLSVALHGPTHAHASIFTSAGVDCSCVTFKTNTGAIELYFSGADVGIAKALAYAFELAATEAACIAAGAAVIAGDAEIAVTPDAGRWL